MLAALVIPRAEALGQSDIVIEADWILSLQTTTGVDKGLIQANFGTAYCNPYFANIGASGLAAATAATGDPKYVNAAWSWLDWYAAHMNGQGFVTNYKFLGGKWVTTGKMDSTDAYAGAFLIALRDAYVASGNLTRLQNLWPAVPKALNAIIATDNGGWLTYALPDYPQAFLMDNIEAYEGFRAVEYLAGEVIPDGAARTLAGEWTSHMPYAFETYWNQIKGGYDAAIGFDGIHFEVDWTKLYPGATAQAWMVRSGLVPANRALQVMQHVQTSFPNWASSGLQPDGAWWPEVVQGMRWAGLSTAGSQGLTTMMQGIVSKGRAWPYHVGNAGVLIMQMAGDPETLITSGPPAYMKPGPTTVSFAGVSQIGTAGAVSYECSVDGSPFLVCSSPYSVPPLPEGLHSVRVRTKDAAGHVDPTPVPHSWTPDGTPPVIQLTQTPTEPGNASPVIKFTASDVAPVNMITFDCALDAGGFSPCTSPATLKLTGTGTHTFKLRATDPAGNASLPQSFTWFADGTPPETAITSATSGTVPTGDAHFEFTGSDDQAGVISFQCRLGSNPFAACASPVNLTVPEGSWTFQVRTVDAVGNPDPSPASASWFVDSTPPQTTMIEAPAGPTRLRSAKFVFAGNDNVGGSMYVSFQCSLDGAAWVACASPKNVSNLIDGPHTFEVRAIDGAGYIDPTPARADWIVDVTAPVASIQTPENALLVDVPPMMMRAVTGPVNDDAAGVASVTVTFTEPQSTGGATYTVQAMLNCSDTGKLQCTWKAPAPAKSGRYTVHAWTVDYAGNQTTATPASVTVFVV